jgi:hypothetical protein
MLDDDVKAMRAENRRVQQELAWPRAGMAMLHDDFPGNAR